MSQPNKKEKVFNLLKELHEKLNIRNYLEDLEKDNNFITQINQKIKSNQIFQKRVFNSIYEFSVYRNFIYSLIRNQKPSVVLETGVLHGLTSAWILKALKDNKKGKLISIDLPRRDWEKFFGKKPFGPGGQAEFELQDEELNLGPSSKFLEDILKKNKEINLFIHDSDHSYEVMKYECDLVQKYLDNIDIVIDDHYCNEYYKEFSEKFNRDYHFIDDIDDNQKQVQGSLYFPRKKS